METLKLRLLDKNFSMTSGNDSKSKSSSSLKGLLYKYIFKKKQTNEDINNSIEKDSISQNEIELKNTNDSLMTMNTDVEEKKTDENDDSNFVKMDSFEERVEKNIDTVNESAGT